MDIIEFRKLFFDALKVPYNSDESIVKAIADRIAVPKEREVHYHNYPQPTVTRNKSIHKDMSSCPFCGCIIPMCQSSINCEWSKVAKDVLIVYKLFVYICECGGTYIGMNENHKKSSIVSTWFKVDI